MSVMPAFTPFNPDDHYGDKYNLTEGFIYPSSSGNMPPFFQQKQFGNECGMTAMNNFLGDRVFSLQTMDEKVARFAEELFIEDMTLVWNPQAGGGGIAPSLLPYFLGEALGKEPASIVNKPAGSGMDAEEIDTILSTKTRFIIDLPKRTATPSGHTFQGAHFSVFKKADDGTWSYIDSMLPSQSIHSEGDVRKYLTETTLSVIYVGIIPTARVPDLTVTSTNLEGQRKGSINPSNLCYLNSACTLFSNDYTHLLSSDVEQREGESRDDFTKRQTLQRCLKRVEFHINAAQGPVPADETTAVLGAIRAIKSGDDNWARSTIHTQNTSAEALNIMIEALSDVEGSAPIIEEVFFNLSERGSRSEQQPSLILGLPTSTQETTLTGYVNQDVEVPFSGLVESYFSVEEIPDHATYTNKQARLRTAPPALSFEIKRAVLVGDRRQKAKNLSHITDIPSELDVKPYLADDSTIDETRYRLTGFSLHSGLRSTSGHYITVSFNPRIDRWELLSDSYVESFESFEKLKEEVEATHLSPLRFGRRMNFGEAIAAVNYRKVDA
jgi:hypothetical protein